MTTTSPSPLVDDRLAVGPRRRPAMAAVLGLIRLYQLARGGRPSPCRYLPTCSEYALEAVQRRGAVRGGWLALKRIGRCHPWGRSGVDPVPD